MATNRSHYVVSHLVRLAWIVMGFGVSTASAKLPIEQSVVRVSVTRQSFSFVRPWEKNNPVTLKGMGTVISGDRILVTAALVRDATFVELETLRENHKIPARIENVDYLSNLAILRPETPDFLRGMRPLKLRQRCKVGDSLDVWQFDASGGAVASRGEIKSIEVNGYPTGESAMLVYNVHISLSLLGSSITLPVLYRGRLAGVLMSHNPGSQAIRVIPGPVIKHYLDDLDDGDYAGFPRAAFGFTPLVDPQLRRYLQVPEHNDGVYVSDVRPGGAADAAGLRVGDVLLSMDGFDVDRHGQYMDPDFGRQSLAHLTTTRTVVGQTRYCRILRDGVEKTLAMTLEAIAPADYPVPPYIFDTAPDYVIVSGFVFQELSRDLLRSWGGDWQTSAPPHLVHYERHQWALIPPGEHRVVLTQVLPAPGNVGYHHLRLMTLDVINGRRIAGLADVADALRHPVNGRHKIEFAEDPKTIYLDAVTAAQQDAVIQQLYRIPRLRRLTTPAPQ